MSKATLDMAVRPSGEAWQSTNDETGVAAVVDRLQALAPQVMVLEATSGLERQVDAALALAGLSVAVVNLELSSPCQRSSGQISSAIRTSRSSTRSKCLTQ